MTYQCKQVDIGDKCIECFRSTSFGQNVTGIHAIGAVKKFILMKIVHLMTYM
jgi:hypothetical protein